MMKQIDLSKTVLGIELGSTRIKAVLLDEGYLPIASGSFTWENELIDGVWTYALSNAETGLQTCFTALKADFERKYAQKLTTVGTIGVSAMMHGYLPFDKDGNQLAAFRTWRNTMTGEAVEKLTELFGFNIPQRWSIAHLYQALLNGEAHTAQIDYCRSAAGVKIQRPRCLCELPWGFGDQECEGNTYGRRYLVRPLPESLCAYHHKYETDTKGRAIGGGTLARRRSRQSISFRQQHRLSPQTYSEYH